MFLRVGVIVLGFATATAYAAAEEAAKPSSRNWRFLPTDYVDTWEVAFHDGDSGAFIAGERGFESMLSPTASRVAAEHHRAPMTGKKGTWAYTYVIVAVPNEKADRGSPVCESGQKAHERIEASFASEAAPQIVWNFTAFTCSEQERARVLDFLFADPTQWSSQMDALSMKVHQLRERDIARLAIGDALDAVQSRLGLANAVARRGAGFELSFWLADSQPPADAKLRFDRAGRLTNWKVERTSGER